MTKELSFDGKGINGPDKYRSRLATFANNEAAQKYGALFEAAPELLVVCIKLLNCIDTNRDWAEAKEARAAIAKATGKAG